MSELHEIEKWVWSEADFEIMGWHDSRIHALAFLDKENGEHEIIFDIDYILQWVHPQSDESGFSFWVAPATLVFEWVFDLNFDIGSYMGELQIDNIKKENTDNPASHLWTIECQEGEITFRSSGYKQYIRAAAQFGGQELDPKSRGYSFIRGKTE